MKHIAISLFCLLIISCSYDKRITRTKYKIGDKAVIIHLPKGYQSWELTGGEEGKTFLFKYPDSSLVYISTMHPGGPIQDTIVKDTKAGGRLFAAWINNESLILSGVVDANHFWKIDYIKDVTSVI